MVCEALGLPVPPQFTRSGPPFPEHNLDVVVQRSKNFQPWNEALMATRLYAFFLLDPTGTIRAIRVETGETLMALQRSATRTAKHQATITHAPSPGVHIYGRDTDAVVRFCASGISASLLSIPTNASPIDPPDSSLLPLAELGVVLAPLLDMTFVDPGRGHDRERGAVLHRAVSARLGYRTHTEPGRRPDIPHQLLELKLQLKQTIDLGEAPATSAAALSDAFPLGLTQRDLRYAVCSARPSTVAGHFEVNSVTLVTGAQFYEVFPSMGGHGQGNGKVQIALPRHWWDSGDGGRAPDPYFGLPIFAHLLTAASHPAGSDVA
jgi:hypothetical protein